MHVGFADDLTLEGSGKGHGDGQLLDLDLNAPQLQGLLDGLIVIGNGFQRAGYLVLAQVDIHDHREAQSNGTGTGGDHHRVNGTEGVHKGRHTLLGVLQQLCQIAGLHIAEDQSGTDGHGDHMDHGGDIVAQRNDTQLQAHLHAALGALLNAVAHHKGHNALGLVVLDHLDHIGGVVCLTQDHGHTGDITGDQRHAQGADNGIGHKADPGIILVGVGTLHVFQAFNNLSANSGGKTGVQGLAQVLLIGDQALQDAHTGGQIAQGLDLHAGSRVNGREEIGSIGECNLLVCAILGNGIVDGILGQSGDCIGTAINQIG